MKEAPKIKRANPWCPVCGSTNMDLYEDENDVHKAYCKSCYVNFFAEDPDDTQ